MKEYIEEIRKLNSMIIEKMDFLAFGDCHSDHFYSLLIVLLQQYGVIDHYYLYDSTDAGFCLIRRGAQMPLVIYCDMDWAALAHHRISPDAYGNSLDFQKREDEVFEINSLLTRERVPITKIHRISATVSQTHPYQVEGFFIRVKGKNVGISFPDLTYILELALGDTTRNAVCITPLLSTDPIKQMVYGGCISITTKNGIYPLTLNRLVEGIRLFLTNSDSTLTNRMKINLNDIGTDQIESIINHAISPVLSNHREE